MAASILKLTFDRQARALVSYNGSVVKLPPLGQSDTITLQIQVVDPTGNFSQPYALVDMAGSGLNVSVGSTPSGNSVTDPPAFQDTFTWDANSKTFTGDLELNTSGIDTLIGAAAAVSVYFEVNVTGTGRFKLFQGQTTILAGVAKPTSTVPAPSKVYLDKSEVLALLSQKLDRLMKSPSGTWTRELGISDDGTPTDSTGPA